MYSITGRKLRLMFPQPLQSKLTLAVSLFIATFFSTYFLEPFDVYPPEHTIPYFWICFFRGALVACLSFLYVIIARPRADWLLHKKLIHLVLFLLLCGTINFLIRDIIYANAHNWSLHFLFVEIRNTFLLGFFIFWLMFFFNYNMLLGEEREKVTISEDLPPDFYPTEKQAAAYITTHVKADDFILPLEHFILAKAEGNYTEVFTLENSRLQKQLKRIPLKSLEEQLSPYPWLVRTHRAYLINQRMVENIAGNAQGYQLALKYYPEKVPVSRAFIPHFNRAHTTAVSAQ